MNESILNSIKKMLGIDEDYTQFDQDIIIHINSVFGILHQIGVGDSSFYISDKSAEWEEFIGEATDLEIIKSYIYLKVRLLFDPPTSGAVKEAITNSINEMEWRINVIAESRKE